MLYGTVTEPAGLPYEGASVEIKGKDFHTLFHALTDAQGHYEINLPDGTYPFVIAVKDYAEKNLEYWAHDLTITGRTELNPRFDSLEVYGLNAFRVRGGYPSLHLYFRPMSLERFRAGADDIAPDICGMQVRIDGEAVDILQVNKVAEYVGEGALTAYLLQVALPENASEWHRVDVEITDTHGHFGMATLFM